MTLTLTLILVLTLTFILTLTFDTKIIGPMTFDYMTLQSTSSQWFYTIPMTLTLTSTLTLTLISTLTFILSLILLDFFRHYSIIWLYTISIVLHHLNDLDLWHYDHWPWPWPPSPTNTILQYTTQHTNTHHIAIISMSYWMSIEEWSCELFSSNACIALKVLSSGEKQCQIIMLYYMLYYLYIQL